MATFKKVILIYINTDKYNNELPFAYLPLLKVSMTNTYLEFNLYETIKRILEMADNFKKFFQKREYDDTFEKLIQRCLYLTY